MKVWNALVVFVLLLAGCGEPRGPYDPTGEPSRVFTCRAEIEQARRMGRVEPGETEEDLIEETAEAIRRRLASEGVTRNEVSVASDGRIVVSIARSERIDREGLEKLLRHQAHLAFRIAVLPRDMLGRGVDNPKPARFPWQGGSEAFHELRRTEREAYRKAHASGTPYRPSDPRFRIVPPKDGGIEAPEPLWSLVEVAQESQGLDGTDVATVIVGENPNTLRPVVLLEIREDRQEAFRAWTAANVGLPMAMLLDGRVTSAPIINEPLSKNVQISMGQGSHRALRTKAKELAAAIGAGQMRIGVTIESEEETN